MCGICAYIGERESLPLLLEGLKKLEYRGYDSAGICILNDSNLNIVKKQGKIKQLSQQLKLKKLKGNIGISHTRWATHGAPSKANAHPQTDCKGEIAIVHNGIIENYQSLKELLKKEGHKFSSETDSEVIAHLIEKFYSGNIEKATIKALKLVRGAFGLAVVHKEEKKIIAARRGSPLILGIGKNEIFVASDIPAILNQTKRIVYLNDNEIACLNHKGYSIKNLDGKEVNKEISEVKWTARQIEKKGFKHFMLKEILEQPTSIENTLRGRVKKNRIKLSLNLETNSIKRIIITACGTSWHSALIGKYIIEKMLEIPVEVDYASEFRYRNPIIKKEDLVIVISQSGETADTLAALREAKEKKAKTLGIINVVGSTMTREVDSGIYLHAGPEIGVASTKAFTCQITALILLSLFIKQEKGEKVNERIIENLRGISLKVKEALKKSDNVRKTAREFKNTKNFLYLGRGLNFPVALEGALKLKEISYIHTEGYPAAEMKHGPIALVDKDMPVVFVSPKDSTYQKILANMEEIKARGGKIIAVTTKRDKKIERLADNLIKVPQTDEQLSPIVNVIPLQLFAYHIADLKGIDVDKPRNLAKSVTVE